MTLSRGRGEGANNAPKVYMIIFNAPQEQITLFWRKYDFAKEWFCLFVI
jgi:hypothetical protein